MIFREQFFSRCLICYIVRWLYQTIRRITRFYININCFFSKNRYCIFCRISQSVIRVCVFSLYLDCIKSLFNIKQIRFICSNICCCRIGLRCYCQIISVCRCCYRHRRIQFQKLILQIKFDEILFYRAIYDYSVWICCFIECCYRIRRKWIPQIIRNCFVLIIISQISQANPHIICFTISRSYSYILRYHRKCRWHLHRICKCYAVACFPLIKCISGIQNLNIYRNSFAYFICSWTYSIACFVHQISQSDRLLYTVAVVNSYGVHFVFRYFKGYIEICQFSIFVWTNTDSCWICSYRQTMFCTNFKLCFIANIQEIHIQWYAVYKACRAAVSRCRSVCLNKIGNSHCQTGYIICTDILKRVHLSLYVGCWITYFLCIVLKCFTVKHNFYRTVCISYISSNLYCLFFRFRSRRCTRCRRFTRIWRLTWVRWFTRIWWFAWIWWTAWVRWFTRVRRFSRFYCRLNSCQCCHLYF